MDKKRVAAILSQILARADVESDGLVNRKVSAKHRDTWGKDQADIEVLLSHVSLLVADLRFDIAATRRELFEARRLLEE
jgi:hypothetical protein